MTTLDKKAARAAWKERKVVAGIYIVRCAATGEAWVGATPDLATVEGRLWFDLKQGRHRSRTLQAAWTTHGPDAFTCRAVEQVTDETDPLFRDRLLKERLGYWCVQLGAERI
jgi:hypothetical protein